MTQFLIFFAIVIASSLFLTRPVRGRVPAWLRIFFPSWRFFEEFVSVPQLRFRVLTDHEEPVPWQEPLLPSWRGASGLFLNAEGNLALACQTLLERFLTELEDASDEELENVISMVSYRLIRNWVAALIRSQFPEQESRHFQFKIVKDGTEIVLSPLHELTERGID